MMFYLKDYHLLIIALLTVVNLVNQRFMKKVHLTRYVITYLNLRLSETLPARNIVSMMFKATRHMLKEFFIFGWMRMYPAKLLRKIPMMATTVLVTPSSQKAISLIQYSSVLV